MSAIMIMIKNNSNSHTPRRPHARCTEVNAWSVHAAGELRNFTFLRQRARLLICCSCDLIYEVLRKAVEKPSDYVCLLIMTHTTYTVSKQQV